MSIDIKKHISERAKAEMNSLKLNVTNSFLSGKICSPLLLDIGSVMQDIDSMSDVALNALNHAGLYITEDGIQVDLEKYKSMGLILVNSSIDAVKNEIENLSDRAIHEITKAPDPNIIMSYVSYWFGKYVREHSLEDLLKDLGKNEEDEVEKQQEAVIQKSQNGISKFMTYTLPKITNKISDTSDKILQAVNTVSSYMAWGPQWVMNQVNKYLDESFVFIENNVDIVLDTVNEFKVKAMEEIGEFITKQMIEKYDKLLQEAAKDIIDKAKENETKVKMKANTALQKANLEIMKVTGIKIPLDKINLDNVNKVKNAAKLAQMIANI